jgi:hypothetical protein
MDPSMKKMLDDLLQSSDVPESARQAVMAAMSDPSKLDDAIAMLKDLGADQIGSGAPLNISDYYVPGPGKYEARWPINLNVPLPIPFDQLDRQTQFFVLFQEWTRRELEGMTLLNSGDVNGAEAVFNECVERARQINVRELEARSYEGLMRVAQRRGDLPGELTWVRKAAATREA